MDQNGFSCRKRPLTPALPQPPLHAVTSWYTLNHMVQYLQNHFNAWFGALSDPTRRGVLEQLGRATTVERKSGREIVVTRTVNAPARVVFEAWTRPELFSRWWVPKSYGLTLLSCEMDVRAGGQYRLVFPCEDSTMEFFGTYLEVTPHSRLVWTNDEGDSGKTITTVTFEEKTGKTLLVVHDLYPSEEAVNSGSTGAMPEAFDQLDEFLASLGSNTAAT